MRKAPNHSPRSDRPRTVRDRNGIEYILQKKLGEGGQGTVWQIQGGALAAKIVRKKSGRQRESLSGKLAFIRRLDLKGLPIAQPLETLAEPHCGYVMRFLRDMVPIKSLYEPVSGEAMTPEWYISTGGLTRRIRMMAKLARLLAQLHAKGLIYGDLSGDNIFISESKEHEELWLIDPDNLTYQSQPTGSESCTYTPGFGAPELVAQTGCSSSLSDNYAFAILCFKVLSLVHPFLGDFVTEGEPELEDAAFEGKMPWIEDPEDDTNRTAHGVSRDWVLSSQMRKKFGLTFGHGKLDRTQRPSAAEWAEVLDIAANSVIQCSECGAGFFFNQPSCHYCGGSLPRFCRMVTFLWDPVSKNPFLTPKQKPKPYHQAIITTSHPYKLTNALANGNRAENQNEILCSFVFDGTRLEIMHPEGLPSATRLLQAGKPIKPSGDKTAISLNHSTRKLEIHFGPSDQEHYFVTFSIKDPRK